MNSFWKWLIGPRIPTDSIGIIKTRESNYIRTTTPNAKIPHQWIEPLREGEDGIVGPVQEGAPRRHYRNAIERVRAEQFEQELVGALKEVLS